MNDKQIDCFIQAATFLNFHKAAEELYLSQPTMTYQVRSLEKELGFALFERRSRGVALTTAGERLYKSLIAIKSSLDRAIEDAREAAEAPQSFSVTWPPAICDRQSISDLVEAFSKAHPNLAMTVRVAEGEHPARVQQEDGVVLTLDKDAARYDHFETVPLFETYIACLFSTSHPLAKKDRVSWDMLKSQHVLLAYPDLYPSSYAALLQEIKLHLPARNLSFLESETTIEMNVAAGRGIGFKPTRSNLLGKTRDGLVAVPLDVSTPSMVCAAYPAAEGNGPMGAFAQFARKFFGYIADENAQQTNAND